jgi:hypothetical protein
MPAPPQPLPQPSNLPPPEPYGGIQSRPLPPPPGTMPQANQDPPAQPLPPPPRPSRAAPQQPADTSPQPGDEVIAEPPSQKVANPQALFSGLDKITGRIINFDAAIGETVQFGALQVTPRACYTRPETESANTDAFIEVDEVTLKGEIKRIFTGWMYASSPGLHAVEHPIYDVWLTDCKGAAKTATAEKAPEPVPPPAVQAKPQQRPARRAPQQRPVQPPQPTSDFPLFR